MRKKVLFACFILLITALVGLHTSGYRLNIEHNSIRVSQKSLSSSDFNTETKRNGIQKVQVTYSPTQETTNVQKQPEDTVNQNKPKIAININTSYYNIQGFTEYDLRHQMDSLGYSDSYGRHDAYTKWDISWSKPCNGLPTVRVNIVFTYPKWLKSDNPDPELDVKWTRYLEALKNHESGHQDIATRATQEIMDTLYNLPKTSNCTEQNQQVVDLGNNIINKYKQEEVQYDNTTNHGQNQGAVFP